MTWQQLTLEELELQNRHQPEALIATLREEHAAGSRWYASDEYSVIKRDCGQFIWLSIKRLDRMPIHDWRDLQRIKNELLGPEFEAAELYPAESRRVDAANQYHLWAFSREGSRFPFGFNERFVTDVPGHGAKQRPGAEDA